MPGIVRKGTDSHVGHASPTPNPFHSTSYAQGSPNVFVNSASAVRIGDATSCGDPAVVGSGNVIVNNIGVHRLGDGTGGHGSWVPNAAGSASGNVIANSGSSILLLEQVADSVDAVKTAYDVPTLNISSTHATGILNGRTFDGDLGIDVDTNEGLEYGDGGLGGKSPVTQQTGSVDTPAANVKFDGNLFPEAKGSIYLNFLSHTDSRIDPRLKTILEEVSKEWGSPLTITSAFRAPEYNKKVGGAKKSTHTEGIATDIRFSNSSVEDRSRFLKILKDKGIKGVGCYFPSKDGGEFFHVDIGGERHWGPNGSRTSQYGWALDVLT